MKRNLTTKKELKEFFDASDRGVAHYWGALPVDLNFGRHYFLATAKKGAPYIKVRIRQVPLWAFVERYEDPTWELADHPLWREILGQLPFSQSQKVVEYFKLPK